MRSKALVLAARPPYEGPWVPIGERDEWVCRVVCRPQIESNGEVEVIVRDLEGRVSVLPPNGIITGEEAKARVKTMRGDVTSVTVFLDEPEKEDA